MTHPVDGPLFQDLIQMHVQLGLVLASLDLNSVVPGASASLIATYQTMGDAILNKYTVTQVKDIVCNNGVFPPSHTGLTSPLFDHMYVIEDLLHE
jgi:hypothetical protein